MRIKLEADRTCQRCGKKHLAAFIWLELDSVSNRYQEAGTVMSERSQGLFPFGEACAKAQLKGNTIHMVETEDKVNFGCDIEHGGYPTSETRTIGQMRRDADEYAGIGRKRPGYRAAEQTHPAANRIVQEAAMNETQKSVDTSCEVVVRSLNAPIMALPIQERTMTLTLKGLNRRGTQAIYTGLRTAVRFPLAAFLNKTAPTVIKIEGDFAPPTAPKAKLTAEQKEAAKLARKNAPKPTEAERIARAEAALAKRKAKLAEKEQPSL